MSEKPSWLDELQAAHCVACSRIPKSQLKTLEAWEGAGILQRRKSGAGASWFVVPSKVESFDRLSMRLRDALALQPSTRAQAALLKGDSKLVAPSASLVNWRRAGDHAHQVPVGLDDLSVFAGMSLVLVENWDTFLQWSDGIARALGVGQVQAIIGARGRELLHKRFFNALAKAAPAKVICAFDFDAAGLSFYLDAKDVFDGILEVAWPSNIDDIFLACRKVVAPRYDLARNAHIPLASDLDGDAKRWRCILDGYSIGVEQQAFYA